MTGTSRAPIPRLESASPSLRVFKIDPHTDSRWRDLVVSHPGGSIYHHPAWIQVIEQEYGQQGEHLACEDGNGQLLAILPMIHTRGLPFNLGGPLGGRRLASLPRTPLAGPHSKDRQATAALLQAALARTRANGRILLQIKSASGELDGLVGDLVSVPWRLSYVLRLPDASEGPFRIRDGQERAKIKWAVNKAAKQGVTVRPAETDTDLRNWYECYLETMRRGVIPARPYRFFLALWKTLRPAGMMELLLAEHGDAGRRTVIGGSIFFLFGGTVSYAFGAMRRKYGPLRANDAIQWQAINDACAKGFHHFDFGEVPDGHTELARFKSKWGAEPTRLYRYYSTAFQAADPGAADGPGGPFLSLARTVWRRLPLWATEWLGDKIYGRL